MIELTAPQCGQPTLDGLFAGMQFKAVLADKGIDSESNRETKDYNKKSRKFLGFVSVARLQILLA